MSQWRVADVMRALGMCTPWLGDPFCRFATVSAGLKHEVVGGLAIDSLLTRPADQKFDLMVLPGWARGS